MTEDNLEEFNFTCTEHCKACASDQLGTMYHAHDAMGFATPVLWLCARCENPPKLVGWYRATRRFIRRTELKVRWYMKPQAERDASRARVNKIRARIEARRAAA